MPDVISWVDPSDVETVLSNQPDVKVMQGPTGRFMPPVLLYEEQVPLQPGSRLRSVQHDTRLLTLPIFLLGDTPTLLRQKLRSFLRVFDPVRGDGILRVTATDGIRRELTCRYAGGLEISEATGDGGMTWQKAALLFRAHDPYWYDQTPQELRYSLAPGTVLFPIFPLLLSSETVFGSSSVVNDGDVDSWPVWTIEGPATGLTLTNTTTGKSLTLTTTLTAADTVTIDTRPGLKTVVKQDGTNLYGSLSSTSSLWQLEPGTNDITISLPGATADSLVALSFKKRYLSP